MTRDRDTSFTERVARKLSYPREVRELRDLHNIGGGG